MNARCMKSVGFTLVILLLKGNAFAQQAKEQPQPGALPCCHR